MSGTPATHTNGRAKGDAQAPYSALEELLRRASLHRTTGKASVQLDLNQGGVTAVRIVTEEVYKNTL